MNSKIQSLINNLREAGELATARMIEICLGISEESAIQHIQEVVEDYSGIRAELCAAFLSEMNAVEATPSNQEIKSQIENAIENGYAETEVGYHAEYRNVNGEWERGCYAQISEPYSQTRRIYAASYSELLSKVEALNS